MNSLKHWTR